MAKLGAFDKNCANIEFDEKKKFKIPNESDFISSIYFDEEKKIFLTTKQFSIFELNLNLEIVSHLNVFEKHLKK
jgi:hypothetical protein